MFDIKKVELMLNEHLGLMKQRTAIDMKNLEYYSKALKALDDVNAALRDLVDLKRHELDPMK